MSVQRPARAAAEVHPALLQPVALTLRPTLGEPVAVETRVLDLEIQVDGSTMLVVACPDGLDPDEHHFDASVAWTYPLGRMECTVDTRPGRRHDGRVWLVRPATAPTRFQERAHFRARLAVPVALAWGEGSDEDGPDSDAEDSPAGLLGVAVDLSEGGLLCTGQLPLPHVGQLVDATVRVDGENLTQAGRVVRQIRFAGGGVGVAVTFVDPDAHGDRIRRVVYDAERRRHRSP